MTSVDLSIEAPQMVTEYQKLNKKKKKTQYSGQQTELVYHKENGRKEYKNKNSKKPNTFP